MATLQKIRNHGAILIVIVGLAMLAFILGDFLNSGSSFFNRNREYVGEIAGHKVHFSEYEQAKDQLNEVYKIETGRSDFNEDMTAQMNEQIWQFMLMDYTLQAEGKLIGMEVTPEELSELCIGEHPHQVIAQRRPFMDENGQFSREGLVRFLHSLETEADNPEAAANIKQAKTYWMYWENVVRVSQMQEKYSALLQNMITANKLDAKYAFDAHNNSIDVDYVMQSYYDIPDSTINVSSSDLKALYNERKPLYKQEPNRGIEYIAFDVVPSEQDFAATEQALKDIRDEFASTEDVLTVVNMNSDVPYNEMNVSIDQVPEYYRDFAFGKGAQKNAFSELQFINGTYTMARLMDCGYSRPDSVCLKLIANKEGQEDNELGWFTENMLSKEMADKAFAAKRGGHFTNNMGAEELTFEVVDIAPATPKVKLAIIARVVSPSSKTYSACYNQAKQFIVENNNEEAVRAAAEQQGLVLNPAYNLNKNTPKIAQLKSSRQIVRWAYEAKEGDISDVFDCGTQYVVAMLTEVKDGDYRPMEDVQGELTILARNNKKAEQMMKDLKDCASLEDAAAKLNVQIQAAENVTLNSYRFGMAGAEPAIIGKALAMADNTTSAPLKGDAGVYMLRTRTHIQGQNDFDVQQEMDQLNMRISYTLPYQAMSMLQEKFDIEDNRSNFQ